MNRTAGWHLAWFSLNLFLTVALATRDDWWWAIPFGVLALLDSRAVLRTWTYPTSPEGTTPMAQQHSGDGIGIFPLVGIIFVILKLTGNLTWPWIWVLAPFWGLFALAAVAGVLIFIAAFIVAMFGGGKK